MSASSSNRKRHLIEGQTKKDRVVSLVRDKEETTSKGDEDHWKEKDGNSWKERAKLILRDKDDCSVMPLARERKLNSVQWERPRQCNERRQSGDS